MLNFAGFGTVRNSPNPDGEYAFAVVWKVTKGFGVFENGSLSSHDYHTPLPYIDSSDYRLKPSCPAVGTITANGVWDRQSQEATVGVVGTIEITRGEGTPPDFFRLQAYCGTRECDSSYAVRRQLITKVGPPHRFVCKPANKVASSGDPSPA